LGKSKNWPTGIGGKKNGGRGVKANIVHTKNRKKKAFSGPLALVMVGNWGSEVFRVKTKRRQNRFENKRFKELRNEQGRRKKKQNTL